MTEWAGTASWFDSCPDHNQTGAGACGTCHNDEGGLAYPNVYGHTPDYNQNVCYPPLANMPEYHCGDYVTMWRTCYGTGNWGVPIVDHGPGAICHVDLIECATPSGYTLRLVDLTPTTFVDIGGNLAQGHILIHMELP